MQPVLGVYRHISAGTCNAKHTDSQANLADARPPGDPVASQLRRPESSSPAASASGLSGRVGGGE